MTENVQDTPQMDTPENQGPPSPKVSDASSPEASPQSGVSVDAVVQEVIKRLDPDLDKKVDQRFKKVSDPRFADVQKVSEYLKAAGGNVEQAARNMLLDEMIEKQAVPQGPSGNVSEEEANAVIEAQTTQILDGAGIAYNDPRYKALYDQYKDRISSPKAWETVLKTAVETWNKQSTPKPAAVVPEGRSVPPPASLQAEYDEAAAKIRQGDIMGLANLKAQFRKKGLEVW